MTLAGTKAEKHLIGLGKSGKTTLQDMREAGAGVIAARGKIHGDTLTVDLTEYLTLTWLVSSKVCY